MKRYEGLLVLEAKLPSYVSGKLKPAGPAEALDLAELCRAQKRYAAAASFYTVALTAAPGLAEDTSRTPRYQAARCAALAAVGKGTEPPAEADRPKLRERALQWLQGELDGWKARCREKPNQYRTPVGHRLRRWQQELDLASLREVQALKSLPEAEVSSWQKFWVEVEAACQRTGVK